MKNETESAGVAELADAEDLESSEGSHPSSGFNSRRPHTEKGEGTMDKPWFVLPGGETGEAYEHHLFVTDGKEGRLVSPAAALAVPELRDALEGLLYIEGLMDEYRMNVARVNRREGTVEAITIAKRNAEELRVRIDNLKRNARNALAKVGK